ncbi:MAG: NAD(P)/FAD-dependent oxidoreductase [Nocardioides sp.]
MADFDVLVIGGGIAGISIASELAATHRVCLVEAEPALAYHTTGRSAATWIGTYGNGTVRALTAASHDFFLDPTGCGDGPFRDVVLGSPLVCMHVGPAGFEDQVAALHADVVGLTPGARLIDAAEATALVPVLRSDWVTAAVVEPGALEIDVAGFHQGYKRGLTAHGGVIHTLARVDTAERIGGRWKVTAGVAQEFTVSHVVNAAGAWVDQVAEIFGAAPVGIQPRLRSIYMVGAESIDQRLPMVISIDEENPFYFKRDSGQYLCSPADATLTTPRDAKPDDLEIARSIDAINEATTIGIRSIRTPWAGLRSFVPDGSPVIGPDPSVEGFFWYAGQGGYGIQMAPAAARLGAALLRGESAPADIVATGFDPASVAPGR